MKGNGAFAPERAVGAADRALAAHLAYDRRGRQRGKAHVAEVARIYLCPECDTQCDDTEKMGLHLERHRPVGPPVYSSKPGREDTLKSVACPKGCGRNFINEPGAWEWKKGFLNEHTPN